VFELPSVAETVLEPDGDGGTVKVQVKVPEELLVTVDGEVICVAPSYLTVIVLEAAKLVPETVTVAPMLPLVGLRVTFGVSVNEADAELTLASVIVTVFVPAI